jgi:hypothetical protein
VCVITKVQSVISDRLPEHRPFAQSARYRASSGHFDVEVRFEFVEANRALYALVVRITSIANYNELQSYKRGVSLVSILIASSLAFNSMSQS